MDTGGPLRRPLPYARQKGGVETMKGQSRVPAREPPRLPTGLELGQQGKGPEQVVTWSSRMTKAAMGHIWGVGVIGSLPRANIVAQPLAGQVPRHRSSLRDGLPLLVRGSPVFGDSP